MEEGHLPKAKDGMRQLLMLEANEMSMPRDGKLTLTPTDRTTSVFSAFGHALEYDSGRGMATERACREIVLFLYRVDIAAMSMNEVRVSWN